MPRRGWFFLLPMIVLGSGCSATSGGKGDTADEENVDVAADVPVESAPLDVGVETPPFDSAGSCAKSRAGMARMPVDIIMSIDQSSSMGNESTNISTNLNDLAKFLEGTKLDYRVILIAGQTGSLPMCVPLPLGDGCAPIKPSVKFRASKRHVDSGAVLTVVQFTYESTAPDLMWSDFLRKDAFKIFVPISDDDADLEPLYSGAGTVAGAWDDYWLAKGPGTPCGAGCFGTKAKRKYAMFPIIGVDKPTAPSAVATAGRCSTAVTKGAEMLGILALTKAGRAFPVCDEDYKPVFEAIAASIGDTVSCVLDVPLPPTGTIDLETVHVEMIQGGVTTVVPRAPSTSCGVGTNGWQLVYSDTKIYLCGEACTAARVDPTTVIEATFFCKP